MILELTEQAMEIVPTVVGACAIDENDKSTWEFSFSKPPTKKEEKELSDLVKNFKATKWRKKRQDARGSVESQLEYIVDNGIEAFITRDKKIKSDNSKK